MRARGARGGKLCVCINPHHVMRARAAARVREVNELLELEACRVSGSICGARHTAPLHLGILPHLLLAVPAARVRTHVVFYRSGRAYHVRHLGRAH